jgi:uncharacterized RDD family membrane protein YckC
MKGNFNSLCITNKYSETLSTMSSIPPPPPSPYAGPSSTDSGSTGLDRIGRDSQLQDHWVRRLIAFIIDSIIVVIVAFALALVFFIPLALLTAAITRSPPPSFSSFFPTSLFFGSYLGLFGGFSLSVGILYLLYFTLADHFWGGTLGKQAVGLRVVTLQTGYLPISQSTSQALTQPHNPTLEQALVRNISKIYWLLLLLDVVVGLGTRGDASQKYSDRYAKTTVVVRR